METVAERRALQTIQNILAEEENPHLMIEGEYYAALASIEEVPEHTDYHQRQAAIYKQWLNDHSAEEDA